VKQALVVGTDDFLITAMRIALRRAPGIQALGVLDRGGSMRRAVRDASPDLVLIEAPADRDLALTRLQELDEECPEALVVLVAAELDVEVFEDAARREMVACLAGPGLGPVLQALLAQPESDTAPSGRIGLASADPAPPSPMPDDPWGMQPACPLTPRQLEILRAVAEGQTNAEIARKLWLTEQTVKFHLSKIYRRLGVSNRTEASRYALLGGWPGAAEPVNQHRVLSGALH
jgi:DNA-binding NarL/FixJ family response regulator